MISLRKTVLGALGALGILAGGTSAQAAPYTELFLSIDESGSIGSTNFYQQMTDYAAVLNSGIIPLDGSLALGVGLFDSGNQLLHAMTQINSQADLDAVIASITGYAGYDGGGTNIAGAIDAGAASLNGFSFGTGLDCASADVNCIIDVSTDGSNNAGNAIVTATALSYEPDIITNCLGIGGGSDCSWVTASGFGVTANSFNDLAAALRAKIIRETGGKVPAPGALLLIGFGLAALGGVSRRRKAA